MSMRKLEGATPAAKENGGQRRTRLRTGLAALALAFAALAILHDRIDGRMRTRAEAFMRRFGLDQRRPDDLQSMALEPAGDLAADVAVDGALRDLEAERPPGSPRSSDRAAAQLAAAQELMLDAVAKRPGSIHHLLLLGQAAHAEQGLAAHSEPASPETSLVRIALWARPLRTAAAAAPGADPAWEALAESFLASWSELAAEDRSEVSGALRTAFRNPDFVGRQFPRAVAVLGSERAAALLPDAARPLRVALRASLAGGDVATAGLLSPRADRAERKQRSADLREIEARGALQDAEGMRYLCQIWAGEHGIQDFDDAPGRSQVARLLDLWPSELVGDWNTDRRGELVMFFFEKNATEARPEAIARAVAALSGAPAPVRARARLLVGQVEDAETIAAAEPNTGSLEWAPYLIALARFQRLRGHALDARQVLDRLSPLSREDCDVSLERREIARALGDQEALDALRRGPSFRLAADLGAAWSANQTLSLCVDPESASGTLEVELAAEAPAFVSFGWDGGRLGSVVITSGRTLSIPLAGLSGRRSFWIKAQAGGPVRPVATRWKPGPQAARFDPRFTGPPRRAPPLRMA
ncbi:MAG: hypothetical protein ABI592_00255 [Acidobacteriota bacterium]